MRDTLGAQTSRMAEEIRVAYRDRERDVQRDTMPARDVAAALNRCAGPCRDLASTRPGRQSGDVETFRRKLAGTRREKAPAAPNAEQLAALTKGYELGLAHLDETLKLRRQQSAATDSRWNTQRMNASKADRASFPRERSSRCTEPATVDGEVFR